MAEEIGDAVSFDSAIFSSLQAVLPASAASIQRG
jgi:hypothetical protein